MTLNEDRSSGDMTLAVALSTKAADYAVIYSVQLSGIKPGQMVHITGQAVATNNLAFPVGLGLVLHGQYDQGGGALREVVPYSMENITPDVHHTVRPFSVYDRTPVENPCYLLKLYAVSSRCLPGDSITVHRDNGFMQAVAYDVPDPISPQVESVVGDLSKQIASLQDVTEALQRDVARLASGGSLDDVAISYDTPPSLD